MSDFSGTDILASVAQHGQRGAASIASVTRADQAHVDREAGATAAGRTVASYYAGT